MKSLLDKVNTKLNAQGGFLKALSILVSGTAGAQLLLILATPILTRLYTPADFGILSAFLSLLAFFAVIANARYELAIHLPEKIEDTVAVTVLAFFCLCLTTLSSIVIILILKFYYFEILINLHLNKYIWMLPFAIFFTGLYQICTAWFVKFKGYSQIATTKLIQSCVVILIQLIIFKLGTFGLIIGQILGQSAGSVNLSKKAIESTKYFKEVRIKKIKEVANRYRNFPIYSMPTGLLNTASLQVAPLIFIGLFGATIAGLYALTLRLVSLPVSLIGGAIGNIFLAEAPKALSKNELDKLILNLNKKLVQIGSIPLIILIFYGPQIFVYILGNDWYKAGVYAQWLAPWIYLQFQWAPISNITVVLELQKLALITQFFAFIIRFGSLFLIINLGFNPDTAIKLFAITSAIIYLLLILFYFNKAKVSLWQVFWTNLIYIFPLILIGYLIKGIF